MDRDDDLVFCGIEVVETEEEDAAEDAAVSFKPELFLMAASLLIFFN